MLVVKTQKKAELMNANGTNIASKLVGDLMTSSAVTVRDNDNLLSAISVMNLKSLSTLPVVDADDRVCGVISNSDLVPIAYGLQCDVGVLQSVADSVRQVLTDALAEDNHDRKVDEVMTQSVLTISPTDTIKQAAHVLVENSIHHLPVVDATNKVVGILSMTDIVRAVGLD